jgi:heme exporter protein D
MINAIGDFLAMGGYAGFVWSAYGLALAVLTGVAYDSWRRYRASIAALDQLQQDRGRRR